MIAIFTDFGVRGPYLGQMKAVLYRDAPGIPVVDIFPDLPAFNVRAAAFLLPAYSQYLPRDSVCLCVVDPGVGTTRRALMTRIDGRWYVGPDNGLFAILQRRAKQVDAFEITWRPEHLSDSFHGRDLFAPVAAAVARGETLHGKAIDTTSLVTPDWPDELDAIVYIDPYGNAISGLSASTVSREACFQVAGRSCEYRRVFDEAQPGNPFWYENSNGLIEIAMPQGSAAKLLDMKVGDRLRRCQRAVP